MGAGRSVVLTTMAALSANQARAGGSVASLRTVRLAENEAVERLLTAPTDNIASALLVAAWQKAVAGLTRLGRDKCRHAGPDALRRGRSNGRRSRGRR